MTALTDRNLASRPPLVVAHADTGYAQAVCRHYQRLGWTPYVAASGPEARRLVRELSPAVVVLGTDWPGESGWLTCGKLLDEHPDLKVVLVTGRPTPADRRFARFLRAAALVHEEDGVRTLAGEVEAVVEHPLVGIGN